MTDKEILKMEHRVLNAMWNDYNKQESLHLDHANHCRGMMNITQARMDEIEELLEQ